MAHICIHEEDEVPRAQLQPIAVCTAQTHFTGTRQNFNFIFSEYVLNIDIFPFSKNQAHVAPSDYLQLFGYLQCSVRRIVFDNDNYNAVNKALIINIIQYVQIAYLHI